MKQLNFDNITWNGKDLDAVTYNGVEIWRKTLLPKEYQQVEYLESKGKQWIDTSVIDDGNTVFEIECSVQVNQQNFPAIFGARKTGNVFVGLMLRNLNSWYYSTSYTFNVTNGIQNKHKYYLNRAEYNKPIYTDDVLSVNDTATTITNLSVYLFGYNSNNKADRLIAGRIYKFLAYKNGNKILNLIPCYRKLDNVAGMYDIISGQFFTNKGTGEFIVGKNI